MATLSEILALAVKGHTAGRLDEAAHIYRHIINTIPDQADSLHLLAVILLQKNQNDQAVDLLERLLAFHPSFVEGYVKLGLALRGRERNEEAVTALRRALVLAPRHAAAHFHLGTLLAVDGQHTEAVDAFREAMACGLGDARYALAQSLYLLGRHDEAEPLFRIIIEEAGPNARWSLMSFGNLLIERRRFDEALTLYQRLLQQSPHQDVCQTVIGDILIAQGRYTEAVSALLPVSSSPWSRTFAALSQAQFTLSLHQMRAVALRRSPVTADDSRVVSFSSLADYGRLGQQFMEYLFVRWHAEGLGLTLETPDWPGHFLFELDDAPITVRRPQVRWSNRRFEERVRRLGASGLAGLDIFSPSSFSEWKPEYTAKARDWLRLRPVWLPFLDPVLMRLRQRGNSIVAIHLRRTDHWGDRKVAPSVWYRRWVEEVWPTLDRPVLYVASDDLATVLPDFISFAPITRADVADPWPGLEYLYDYYVLMNADAVAISQSAFSITATMLNHNVRHVAQPDLQQECLVPYSPFLNDLRPMGPPERR